MKNTKEKIKRKRRSYLPAEAKDIPKLTQNNHWNRYDSQSGSRETIYEGHFWEKKTKRIFLS